MALAAFGAWQARAAHPLLPPRVVLDRDRSGAYLSMLFVSAGLFGTFLFLTHYLQQTLGYSPLVTGVAFSSAAPWSAAVRWLSRARRPQHAARRQRRRRPAPACRHNPAGPGRHLA